MSEAKHTPGPWAWHVDRPTDVISSEPCECSVATIDIGCGNRAEQQANARLIAAAPELLEAGVRLTEEAKAGKGVSAEALNQMLDAIAKARGQ